MFQQLNQYYGCLKHNEDKYKLGFFENGKFIKGQLIRKEFQNAMKNVEYYKIIEGQFRNGFAQGKEVKIIRSDGEQYVGETKKNKMHGEGKYEGCLLTEDGFRTDLIATYKGSFRNGQFNGKGTWESPNFSYTGDFKNEQFNGEGKYLDKITGEIYDGEFKEHKRDGNGKLILAGKYRYDGDFSLNKFHGQGTFNREVAGSKEDQLLPNVRHLKGPFNKNRICGKPPDLILFYEGQSVNYFVDDQ